VTTVKGNSLDQKLGLKEKDLIVEIDGTSLLYENPWNLLATKISGDEINLRVIRGKDMIDLKGKV
jgi:type II secretory pathway component PulC